jgi:hypothetical protein
MPYAALPVSPIDSPFAVNRSVAGEAVWSDLLFCLKPEHYNGRISRRAIKLTRNRQFSVEDGSTL